MSLYTALIDRASWTGAASPAGAAEARAALERGSVLVFPALRFDVERAETVLFSPSILGTAKNASFDPATARVGGTTATGADLAALQSMLRRFSDAAMSLVAGVCPSYDRAIERRRASFRPAEIAGRKTTWRKDDTRLHVDSFPASPSGGKRILRVFTNVNPEGRPRSWRIGGDFEPVAARFAPELRLPWPGSAAVLRLLRITKTMRSPYDALMLQLHDCMKADNDFQANTEQTAVEFPAGSTWMAFTDQVSHAAMAGQYQLEQTFLVPIGATTEPEKSPLRVLERLKGRKLI